MAGEEALKLLFFIPMNARVGGGGGEGVFRSSSDEESDDSGKKDPGLLNTSSDLKEDFSVGEWGRTARKCGDADFPRDTVRRL